MSDAERQSPRTAIRKWLQLTHSKRTAKPAAALPEEYKIEPDLTRRSGRHRRTRFPAQIEPQHDKEARRKHQRLSKSRSRQNHVTDQAPSVNSVQVQYRNHSVANADVVPDGHGLAERLGLHAPFRNFKDHSDDSLAEVRSRSRKRRRCSSATSQYLEPASANVFCSNENTHPSRATLLHTVGTRPALDDRGSNGSPTASECSEMVLPSPKKLLRSYEKRPRHKTRTDRYELKESSEHGQKKKHDSRKGRGEKKQKKYKRKEKSGAALMHNFVAQNVAHDRLTLKPTKTLGLFGKGRASSPVRRPGLPDLAFSEMTFLTSRRERYKDSFEDSNKPANKKKRRMSTKTADTEAEFSRYFTSAKPTSLDMPSSHSQRYQQDSRQSRDHVAPQVLVNLPERPFLGFGSCGPNTSISPAKSLVNRDSRSLFREVSQSPTPSTSYLTWSETRGPSCASPPPDEQHQVEPLKSSKSPNRKRIPSAPHKRQRSVPPVSSPKIQTRSMKAQAAASRPPSEQEIANEVLGKNSNSQLAVDERRGSREKEQNRSDSGTIALNAANISREIEIPIPNITESNQAAKCDRPELAPPNLDQAARHSSRHEPPSRAPAQDLRPRSAQMQVNSSDKDPLDDILDALLIDCNRAVIPDDTASYLTMNRRNSRSMENTTTPPRDQEDLHKPAHVFVNTISAPGPPASASSFHKEPCSAKTQLAPVIDDSPSTHPLSKGSLNVSNRLSPSYSGVYPPGPMENRLKSRNAWKGYDNFYERQQEQADILPETSTGHTVVNEAVHDEHVGSSIKSDFGGGRCKPVQCRCPVEVRDGFDDHRPYMYDALQEVSESEHDQIIEQSEWNRQILDHGASYDSGASTFDVSHERFDDGKMAVNHAYDYQEKEQPLTQWAVEQAIEHRHSMTNVSDNYPLWRPRQPVFSPTDAGAQDVDPGLSEFWTPHKLY